ncbi:hypothetical protein Y1Q_0002433 [Alligator mississippiensis]|uniref:Uncharacterized protein n=1 Tax=Alligator mississippiensis TaxID=8496 RepID=A0A151NY64_ALLMI|nr:hypothetical protein Y1Q_0002433 [Alligator mississippiensis]
MPSSACLPKPSSSSKGNPSQSANGFLSQSLILACWKATIPGISGTFCTRLPNHFMSITGLMFTIPKLRYHHCIDGETEAQRLYWQFLVSSDGSRASAIPHNCGVQGGGEV